MSDEGDDESDETVTLWRPTGEKELALVRDSGWSAWPPRLPEQPIFYPVVDRAYATKIAREWNVPNGGVGYVTSFRVKRAFLERYPIQDAGGRAHREHWIPAEDLDEMNANIDGVIRVEAEYRAAIADEEFVASERSLDAQWPTPWKDYLRGKSWLRRASMPSESLVSILTPLETVDLVRSWGSHARSTHPGVAIIGNDGGRERIAIDVRAAAPKVLLVEITSVGWESAIVQAESIEEFIEQLESETFAFRFEG